MSGIANMGPVRAGVQELEPSMLWSAMVVAGMGAVPNPTPLHQDMHSYLAGPLHPLQQHQE